MFSLGKIRRGSWPLPGQSVTSSLVPLFAKHICVCIVNIATCFGKLVNRLQPSESEKLQVQQHLYTIKNRLTTTFNIRRFLTGGSFSRDTFIRGGSDVDLFTVISKKDVTWGNGLVSSETTLNNIRAELLKRYSTTLVERDIQAVVVPFSLGACVEVVPAVFDQMLNGQLPLYLIPDGDGGWMPTCPELHANYIRQADTRSGGKLKRVAQLLKYWRESRSPRVTLSSFHIEMILASENICIGVKSYAACFTETLQLLAQRECRALQDPAGVAGYIPAVKTEAQRESTLTSVRYSRDHAKDACWRDYSGNTDEAWRQWNIVFNNTFPK
jgi:hypothetical protein